MQLNRKTSVTVGSVSLLVISLVAVNCTRTPKFQDNNKGTPPPQAQTPGPSTPTTPQQVVQPKPQTPTPQTPTPQTPAPQTPAPQAPAPQTPAPAPQTPAPQTPAPKTPAPKAPAPQAPAPQTPAPKAPPAQTQNPDAQASLVGTWSSDCLTNGADYSDDPSLANQKIKVSLTFNADKSYQKTISAYTLCTDAKAASVLKQETGTYAQGAAVDSSAHPGLAGALALSFTHSVTGTNPITEYSVSFIDPSHPGTLKMVKAGITDPTQLPSDYSKVLFQKAASGS